MKVRIGNGYRSGNRVFVITERPMGPRFSVWGAVELGGPFSGAKFGFTNEDLATMKPAGWVSVRDDA